MLAFGVERRTRDIGVRMALGATPTAVARLVFSEAGLLVGGGGVAGTTAAAWLSSLVESYLYGVGPRDAAAFVVASAVMSVAALVAAVVPVRRAVRVEPVVALVPSDDGPAT
jgi:ABC-type antimicrobial peptide transport system permease subunit